MNCTFQTHTKNCLSKQFEYDEYYFNWPRALSQHFCVLLTAHNARANVIKWPVEREGENNTHVNSTPQCVYSMYGWHCTNRQTSRHSESSARAQPGDDRRRAQKYSSDSNNECLDMINARTNYRMKREKNESALKHTHTESSAKDRLYTALTFFIQHHRRNLKIIPSNNWFILLVFYTHCYTNSKCGSCPENACWAWYVMFFFFFILRPLSAAVYC